MWGFSDVKIQSGIRPNFLVAFPRRVLEQAPNNPPCLLTPKTKNDRKAADTIQIRPGVS